MTGTGMVSVWLYVSNRHTGCKINKCNRMESFIKITSVESKCNDKMLIFTCIYRPPQGNINNIINALNDILTYEKYEMKLY